MVATFRESQSSTYGSSQAGVCQARAALSQVLSLFLLFILVSLTSVISNCLSLLFGLRKGLKLEAFSTKEKQGMQRGFCARRPPGPAGFQKGRVGFLGDGNVLQLRFQGRTSSIGSGGSLPSLLN